MKPTDFAIAMQKYFTLYLVHQRVNRENTIKSYRDTFKLFLEYMSEKKKISPNKMTLDKFTCDEIEGFMEHIVVNRKCSERTKNQRLASIHSFVKFLQYEYPENMFQWQRIQAMPVKRFDSEPVKYLTQKETLVLIESIKTNSQKGLRDKTLIVALYDMGARVQELVDISVGDVRLGVLPQIKLLGKGGKTRIVPLMPATTTLLKEYMKTYGLMNDGCKNNPLFFNRHGNRLTRFGITYILQSYGKEAKKHEPSIPEKLTPHVLRHSKAMHLLEEGCSEIVIQHLLGHASLKTTSIYARANVKMMREALDNADKAIESVNTSYFWNESPDILAWLKRF